MLRIAFLLLPIFLSNPVAALAQQDSAPVRQAIGHWLNDQLKGLPGEASYEIGSLAAGNQLAPCTRFDIGRPPGASAWGRGHVTVRCLDAPAWRINVPVHIRVKADYYVAARPIAQGQAITADDLATQLGDLSALPARIVTDGSLAIGKMAAVSIPAGSPLRTDMLRAMTVIRQGQSVRVISRGSGFEVTNEGRALGNAAEGQLAQIKMAGGQVVSGIARAGGIIEINF